MKIYCDKCGQEIGSEIDVRFDKLQIGHIICPKCHKVNRRYISETDLLLYLGVSETFYLIMSIITTFIMERFKLTYITIISILLLLIVAFIVQKQIDRFIYEKAYFKENQKYIEFEKDIDATSRSLTWQSMLYLALVITFITTTEAKLFFLLVSIAAIVLTFVKFYLSLKNERNK